jgi:hypothetical protein
VSYERRQKEFQKELEKWQKEQQKKKRRGEPYDSIYPQKTLDMKFTGVGTVAPDQRLWINAPVPLAVADSAAIHLRLKVDSLWNDVPCRLVPSTTNVRSYRLEATLEAGQEYSLETDSAAFVSIYGVASNFTKQTIKVKTPEDYSKLIVTLSGADVPDSTSIVVQMLNGQDKVVKQQSTVDGTATFLYVIPGKYYLRAFIDMNGNGRWDTGDYDQDLQAEPVYYYPEETECKEKWELKRQWNLTATPRFKQKPAAITKQKADKERKLQNRNAQRAKQLGIEYIKDKTGISL